MHIRGYSEVDTCSGNSNEPFNPIFASPVMLKCPAMVYTVKMLPKPHATVIIIVTLFTTLASNPRRRGMAPQS
jgi:hypothetical protein